jgi:hypothetical protein
MIEVVAALHRAGVPVVAGTTKPCRRTACTASSSCRRRGPSPARRRCKRRRCCRPRTMAPEREVGTVEAGKRADLLVVDGDPLARALCATSPWWWRAASSTTPPAVTECRVRAMRHMQVEVALPIDGAVAARSRVHDRFASRERYATAGAVEFRAFLSSALVSRLTFSTARAVAVIEAARA